MKKVNILLVFIVIIFVSCEQSDDLVNKNHLDGVADVKVENGYLVFKNDEVFNSIREEVSQMNDSDYYLWANSLGFTSIEKHYEPVFSELKTITNLDDLEVFVNQYKDEIKVEQNELGEYSFDYPVIAHLWMRFYNKDAVFKVGNILHSYKEDYIAVYNTDKIDLNEAKRLVEGQISPDEANEKGFYYASAKKENELLKSATDLIDDPDHDWSIANFEIKSGARKRIKIKLEYLGIIGNEHDGRYNIKSYAYLWMKSEKRTIFWYNVASQYRIEEFCAQVGYYDINSNAFANEIYSATDYSSQNTSNYTQFIFDSYKKIFPMAGGAPEADDNCVRYINARFKMTGSIVDWMEAQERHHNPSFDYHLSWSNYQSGFPYWEYQ